MDTIETIKNRRSIRKFKTDPVDDKTLEIVLDAARLAPSWANTQCWRFIVVRDSSIKSALAGTLVSGSTTGSNPGAKAVIAAPVLIIACAIKGLSGYYSGKPATSKGDIWYMLDIGIAMEHLMLAAASLGLGTVHLGLFDSQKASEILQIPDNIHIVEMTPLGYPEYQPDARPRKSLSEIVYYEKFGQAKTA